MKWARTRPVDLDGSHINDFWPFRTESSKCWAGPRGLQRRHHGEMHKKHPTVCLRSRARSNQDVLCVVSLPLAHKADLVEQFNASGPA